MSENINAKLVRVVYICYMNFITVTKTVSVDKSDFPSHVSLQSQMSHTMEIKLTNGEKHEKLCYNGQQCHRIPEALVKLYGPKVHSLDLSYNELVTLKGLEGFPLLKELVLDNNQLTDTIILPYLPHLQTLSLNKNRITDIESLIIKIQHNLPVLSYLSLLGNKACPNELSDLSNDEQDYQLYRYYVLHHLPKLKFLDSTKVLNSERREAINRGQYMKIVRPKVTNASDFLSSSPLRHSFTPLPRTVRNPDDHKGVYAKCRYRYSGKHSEGNRFISNNDL